jgi:hypothetical protein
VPDTFAAAAAAPGITVAAVTDGTSRAKATNVAAAPRRLAYVMAAPLSSRRR